jgi:hypothetical protein
MSTLLTLRNALLATAAALFVALGIETDWGAALTAPPLQSRSGAVKQDATSVLPDFRLGSEASAYSQIVDRPLLNPSRKPAPTQLVTAAPEPPKPQVRRGLYQLIGITDLGVVKIAQVREISSNRVKSVRQGDQLQEMTVTKVEPTQVTLAFQGETDVIELAKFTASGRVPQPAPPPPVIAQAPPPLQNPMQPPAQSLAAAAYANPIIAAQLAASGQAAAPVVPVAPVAPAPAATPPAPTQPREVISVVEMLERRRLARQQAGGQ